MTTLRKDKFTFSAQYIADPTASMTLQVCPAFNNIAAIKSEASAFPDSTTNTFSFLFKESNEFIVLKNLLALKSYAKVESSKLDITLSMNTTNIILASCQLTDIVAFVTGLTRDLKESKSLSNVSKQQSPNVVFHKATFSYGSMTVN
jgi:hypothetical protein